MRTKRLICALRGHEWDRDWRVINTASTWFARVNCQRCGLAIDGAALKRIEEIAPRMTRGL